MHIDLDRVVAHLLAPTAQVLDQLILAHQPTRTQHQNFEQTQFARRQIEHVTVEQRAAVGLVEGQHFTVR